MPLVQEQYRQGEQGLPESPDCQKDSGSEICSEFGPDLGPCSKPPPRQAAESSQSASLEGGSAPYGVARSIGRLFSVFHLVVKHCLSCLIYYVQYKSQFEKVNADMLCTGNQSCIFTERQCETLLAQGQGRLSLSHPIWDLHCNASSMCCYLVMVGELESLIDSVSYTGRGLSSW